MNEKEQAMITADDVRNIVLALPETEEHEHWGKPSFRVKNKIFATLQPDGVTLTVKTTHEDRMAFTAMAPEVYSVPDSFAKLAYMMVRMDRIEQEECRGLLLQAWSLVAPKGVVKAYEASLQ
jgi:hypothetical protein